MAAQSPTPPPSSAMPPSDDAAHWRQVLAHGSTPAHFVYTKPIQKSEQDDREYRVIRLENGLQAVLVHDADTDKAAASLDVGVGHLSDPVSVLVRFLPVVSACVAHVATLMNSKLFACHNSIDHQSNYEEEPTEREFVNGTPDTVNQDGRGCDIHFSV